MTDNEIIKDLKEHYINKGDRVLIKNTIDLINRQKAEIERLQQKNSELESDLILKTYDYEHLLMKCKELQAISSSRKDRLMQTVVKLQTAKSEARKEFAERLKEEVAHIPAWGRVAEKKIDNLLKEMESESDVWISDNSLHTIKWDFRRSA